MSGSVNPIPNGFHTITAHIVVKDSRKAIEFYKKAFGAQDPHIAEGPDGGVMHATVKIGDSILMLNDEFPDFHVLSPTSTNADTCVRLNLYVPDANKVWKNALDAGATVVMPLQDQFWGDRYGQVQDPFGHRWSIAQHIKDLTPEEMKKAQDEAMASMPKHS
jgi:uncharacterized glyoxalase superfamily protein PhnB